MNIQISVMKPCQKKLLKATHKLHSLLPDTKITVAIVKQNLILSRSTTIWTRRETRWQSRRTLSSPPLMSTPKSQLVAGQPLIKKKTGTQKRKYLACSLTYSAKSTRVSLDLSFPLSFQIFPLVNPVGFIAKIYSQHMITLLHLQCCHPSPTYYPLLSRLFKRPTFWSPYNLFSTQQPGGSFIKHKSSLVTPLYTTIHGFLMYFQ